MSAEGGKAILPPTTRVAVLETGGRLRPGWQCCEVGREITFETTGLESYCLSNWEPAICDAFLVTAAVDFCDRIARRPCLGWGRHFEVSLPVHDPERWSGQVSEQLIGALAFLTGDR